MLSRPQSPDSLVLLRRHKFYSGRRSSPICYTSHNLEIVFHEDAEVINLRYPDFGMQGPTLSNSLETARLGYMGFRQDSRA